MKKVTIVEVAQKAGTSSTTVSRVLNDNTKEHMREETKQRVLKAIKELRYTPDKYARFMRKQKSGVIGVLVPDISNQFFSLMVRGVESISYQNGYSVIICDAENSLEKEKKYIDILLNERVEGAILTSSGVENNYVEKFTTNKIPIILADRKLKNVSLPYVGSDGSKDGYAVTQYIINLGFKEIGFVKGPFLVTTATERFEGYKKAMVDNGLTINDNYLKEGDYTFEGGVKAGSDFVSSPSKLPQVIIAANDLMGVGIIRAIEKRRLKVPRDVGVVGFDNIPLSSLVNPKLTTMEIPAYTIGQEAILLLLDYIRGKRKRRKIKIVDTKLIEGESCRCVK